MSKESLKNFVDNLDKGDNAEAQKNFNDAMADKVSATLDDAKLMWQNLCLQELKV